MIITEWQLKEIVLENGTQSEDRAAYFRLEWKVGGYRLNGLKKRDVQMLEHRKKDYMTSRGYSEESGFVGSTHRVEGKNSMWLLN
jgi:hypothetical protein